TNPAGPRPEGRTRDQTYNPTPPADLEKSAAGFPWRVYFREADLGKADRVVVRQNTAVPKLAAIFADTPVETLKAWEAFSVADEAAPYLSKGLVDLNWEVRSELLEGAAGRCPPGERAVEG